MGNYNGKVRCSYCYAAGHNKRTCNGYTGALTRRMNTYKESADANPEVADHYMKTVNKLAVQIGKRTGTNPLSGAVITKRGPTRKCSYCKYKHGSHSDLGLGHTRRTCPDLKADYSDAVAANAVFRAGILKNMRRIGLGTGALISQVISGHFKEADGTESWDRRPVVTMVKGIYWEKICYTTPHDHCVWTQRMDRFNQRGGASALPHARAFDEEGHSLRFSSKNGGVWGCDEGALVGQWGEPPVPESPQSEALRGGPGTQMLAMVPSETIQPPEGWETGDCTALKAHFADLKK